MSDNEEEDDDYDTNGRSCRVLGASEINKNL